MNTEKQPKTSFFRVIFETIRSQIGVYSALFLSGLAALFVGIWGLWSIFGALTVCGGLLIGVAIFSIVFANLQGSK